MEKQKGALKNIKLLYESRQAVIELFNDYSSIASEAKYKIKNGEGLKMLTPKEMLQRLPIALAQIKAGSTSENLLNKITQIIYSLCRAKEITEKVYNNIMNSAKVQYKMNNLFMNSKNSKTSDPHRLSLNLTNKIEDIYIYIALSNLSIYYTWKNIKKSYKNNEFKVSGLT